VHTAQGRDALSTELACPGCGGALTACTCISGLTAGDEPTDRQKAELYRKHGICVLPDGLVIVETRDEVNDRPAVDLRAAELWPVETQRRLEAEAVPARLRLAAYLLEKGLSSIAHTIARSATADLGAALAAADRKAGV
jgi:hypothetical protein